MKRPSFQWYPADWRNNAKLRRCTWAARGAWVDVLGLLHDSDEYGVLRWPWREIAGAIGSPPSLVRELVDKLVLKGCDSGSCSNLVFIPRHGRKEGAPVMLIFAQPGPIWFSSRMVRDEYIRVKKGGTGEAPMSAPMPPIGDESVPRTRPRTPARTSSSSSSEDQKQDQEQDQETGPRPPDLDPPHNPPINGHHGKSGHGTRLVQGWSLPEEWLRWSLGIRPDWDEERALRESLVFRDYWHAKAGADARKVDWLATWRNWVRRAT